MLSHQTVHPSSIMRIPKELSPRLLRNRIVRFGNYDYVSPAQITPRKFVPDHIVLPEYGHSGKPQEPSEEIEIKNGEQIQGMKRSCSLAASILQQASNLVKPGITTDAVDAHIHELCVSSGAYPSPLNYKGFPKSICTSVNNVAVHGIPDLRLLQDGDIINVDITVYYEGYHGDCSKTFLVGDVDEKGKELVLITEESLNLGISVCGPEVPFSEIGATISKFAKKNKLSVLPTFVGHGIGSYFHGPPEIYHALNKYPGRMHPGMTFTVEPVLSHGGRNVYLLDDGWTIVTADGARTAQAEHTILVTQDGVDILTA